MTDLQKKIRFIAIKKLAGEAPKTVDGKEYAFKEGAKVLISKAEIDEGFKLAGETSPHMVAYEIYRWKKVWEPFFTVIISGDNLRVTVAKDHNRNISTYVAISETEDGDMIDPVTSEPKIKLKKEETLIDVDYFAMPLEAEFIEMAIKKNKNVFLAGPTGCGKTQLLVRLCKKNSYAYERVNMDGDFSKSDFVGDWQLISSEGSPEMTFGEGLLPKAMREGAKLIIDELDAAPQEVLFTIQAVLEGAPLVNTKTGERVMPKEGFCILATANTVGKGDMSSLYAGTRMLNEATLDRFHYILQMGYPALSVESTILVKTTGISKNIADEISRLAESIRISAKDQEIFTSFSMRKSMNFASALMDGVNPQFAFRATVLDRSSSEDSAKIHEIASRILSFLAKAKI